MSKHLVPISLLSVALLVVFFVGYRPSLKLISSMGQMASVNNSLTNSTSSAALTDIIKELQDHEQLLSNEIGDLRSKMEVVNLKSILTRDLQRGDSGNDVNKLQELLSSMGMLASDDASSTPVTGHYGPLTKTAVIEFQTESGLKQTGKVDKNTRYRLLESAANLAAEGTSTGFLDPSAISDLQNVSAVKDQVSQLASDLTDARTSIADLQNHVSQLSSDLSSMQQSIDALNTPSPMLEPSPMQPNPPPPSSASTSTPAAPPSPFVISNVQVANITRTSSTITWVTNSSATSQVDYSQNSNLSGNKASGNPTMVISHSVTITSLNSGTRYYYRLTSKNSSGTMATSATLSFSTLH